MKNCYKYIFVILSMGAYAYVSNQTFENESSAKKYAQVQYFKDF